MLFGLDDGREVKSLRFLLSEMDMKTFQVEDIYRVRGPYGKVWTLSVADLWPKRGER